MKKIAIIPVALLSALLLSSCKEEVQEVKPLELQVIEAKAEPFANSYDFSGFTAAEGTVEIRARVSGYILERKFKEGDYVKKGQRLFLIEPYMYQADLKNAQGQLMSAKANVEKTSFDLARSENLLKSGNTSKASYDAAKANYDAAQAQLMQAEGALQIAQLNLGYTNVEAPISGKISMSNFDVGNLVGPDSGVLTTIVNSDPIHVNIGISEGFLIEFNRYLTSPKELAKIKAKMKFRDGSHYNEDGRISFFDVFVDVTTNTVNAKAEFKNQSQSILPGQYVTITITEPLTENKIILPQEVVLTAQGGRNVMVLENGVVASRTVTVGQDRGKDIVIESGLKDGDLVIANSLQKIRTGQKAKPVKIKPGKLDDEVKTQVKEDKEDQNEAK